MSQFNGQIFGVYISLSYIIILTEYTGFTQSLIMFDIYKVHITTYTLFINAIRIQQLRRPILKSIHYTCVM